MQIGDPMLPVSSLHRVAYRTPGEDMTIEPLFTFEAAVYHADAEPSFELCMRFGNRIVWTAKTPLDFGLQYTDDPYEPSSRLTPADLTWALNRCGWRKLSDWDSVGEEGFLMASIVPTEFATPEVSLPASVLAALS